MNCLGKGNYVYFIAMLLSISIMLSYGAYLALIILAILLQRSELGRSASNNIKNSWSAGTTWTTYFNAWGWAIAEDVRVGSVGLLALLTAPLAWGLFLYHIYLIWAGMTTNESAKWADWRDDIGDGLVYKKEGESILITSGSQDSSIEPWVDWPVRSRQIVVRSVDGLSPLAADDSESLGRATNARSRMPWKRVQSLAEIENLYDLGFLDNLHDVLPST